MRLHVPQPPPPTTMAAGVEALATPPARTAAAPGCKRRARTRTCRGQQFLRKRRARGLRRVHQHGPAEKLRSFNVSAPFLQYETQRGSILKTTKTKIKKKHSANLRDARPENKSATDAANITAPGTNDSRKIAKVRQN